MSARPVTARTTVAPLGRPARADPRRGATTSLPSLGWLLPYCLQDPGVWLALGALRLAVERSRLPCALSARSRKNADGSGMRVAGERRPPRPRGIRRSQGGSTARHGARRHGPLTLLALLRD